MGIVYQIRGTNGSGKSYTARSFLPPKAGEIPLDEVAGRVMVRDERLEALAMYYTKAGSPRRVVGYIGEDPHCIVVGSYSTMAGGMDKLPDFQTARTAIWKALELSDVVICEGILASTVYGSWADFDDALQKVGHKMAWCYLDTSPEVCLERIKMRQAEGDKERVIKEDLVRDKWTAIRRTRARALANRRLVYDLPVGHPPSALVDIINGRGERYLAQR